MAISRPTAAARPPSSTDSSSAAAMVYSPNFHVDRLLCELIARDRETQLFSAIRNAAAKQTLPLVLQKLLSRLAGFLNQAGEAQICKGFEETYSIFSTDEGRKAFFGEDPPPDRMITKPTYATPFVTSVKLMQSIEELEQAELPAPASLQWSSVGLLHTLYCHYYLFELNADTPVEHHPALVFWVKTVVRYEHLRLTGAKLDGFAAAENGLKQEIAYLVTRYLALNLNLATHRPHDVADAEFVSPSEFLADTKGLVYPHGVRDLTFKAEYFVEVLESQCVGFKKHCPDMDPEVVTDVLAGLRGGSSSSALRENGSTFAITASEPAIPSQPTQDLVEPASLQITPTNFDAILPRLDRTDAHQLLVNLPLNIPSMETLNAIFARLQSSAPDDALAPLDLDPTIIACGYIQHGLRQLERQRPSTSRAPAAPGLHDFASGAASASSSAGSSSTASAATTATSTSADITAAMMMDKPAEANPNGDGEVYAPADDAADTKRKISLLLLFMKNLLRKNHVSFAALQYDIQEICTRYSPIREVREFRRWIETGVDS